MPKPNDNLVDMGYIANVFGIKGWVKIKFFTEYADSLAGYKKLIISHKNGKSLVSNVIDYFVKDDLLHAKLYGIDDRNSAFEAKGSTISVSRDDFDKIDSADEFYWTDLIGLKVTNLKGENFGLVDSLMDTGANEVLVVKDNKQTRLIPFVGNYVTDVSLEKELITVDWEADY